MKVGFYQFTIAFGDKARNVDKVFNTLSRAEFDLLVLPELFNTGFLFSSRQEVMSYAEPVPDGETSQNLIALARQKRAYLVAGLAESDNNHVYNTAILVGPHGFVGKHRKTHLAPVERPLFDRGHRLDIFDLGSVRVGIAICLESWFPEICQLLTLQGAQVICNPANFAGRWNTGVTKVRARENRIHIISANRTGMERWKDRLALFRGESQIVDPDGVIVYRADSQECLIVQEIHLAQSLGRDPPVSTEEQKNIARPRLAVTDERRPQEPQTVLVVEDDPGVGGVVCAVLEEAGYQILQAPDGATALSVLQNNCPDLILSDVVMPGMDGFAFYQQVRSQSPGRQTPFIFLAAGGQRADIRHGMALGADDYITKPFEPEELLDAVAARLTRAATTEAAVQQATASARDSLLRTLNHEFRTPLALLMGYAELLEECAWDTDDGEFHRLLQGLRAGSEHLLRLVEDFLLLTRLESGAEGSEWDALPPQTAEPDELLDNILAQFKPRAAAKSVSLALQQGAPQVCVVGNSYFLTEIIRRLVDNSLKPAAQAGGRLVLRTRQEQGCWLLEIAGQGIGIRPMDHARTAQQEARLDLIIVQRLVRLCGGSLAVESEPGRESTWTLRLPLAR
jgi:predicted amidohydrolase/signal transduction histidine kinase